MSQRIEITDFNYFASLCIPLQREQHHCQFVAQSQEQENKRSSILMMMMSMQTTSPSILVFLMIYLSCNLYPCSCIGSRLFGLPGHYDRAYASRFGSRSGMQDAWRSHNYFSRSPILQMDWVERQHYNLPPVLFASAPVVRRASGPKNAVINPADWMIQQRVPFISSRSGSGSAAAVAPRVWDPAASPFVVGPAAGQAAIEPPAHQHDDGQRHGRIPFLTHLFND